MLTKYKLRIGSNEYELQDDDLKNWDEVKCVFKRADFGGVVRTFTSKFEFTNEAYRLLMQEYDLRGFRASATITIYVINDNWMYEPLFYCDLDFSSLTYTEYVLSMNAIDDSIASRIKAAKSTKFEFVVGEDIPVNGTKYLFDRIKMLETATYAITGGESAEDGSLTGDYTTDNNHRIYVGLTNSEIAIGKAVHLNEDQEPGDGYLFLSKESLDITLEYRPEMKVFDDEWRAAGGTVIVSGVTYGCNGTDDLTYEEAVEIKQLYSKRKTDDYSRMFFAATVRALLPVWLPNASVKLSSMFQSAAGLTKIVFRSNVSPCIVRIGDFTTTFHTCSNLKEIDGVLDVSNMTSPIYYPTFMLDGRLEDVWISGLKYSANFQDCKSLSLASLQYLVDNAANTTAITITVHPDVYSKLTDENNTEWNALLALAAEKNITFATV